MTEWIIAIVAVALPVVLAIWWILAGAAKKRGLATLAKERGWDFFSGARLGHGASGGRHEQPARGRAPAPLRRVGESIDQAVVGTHRGKPFGVYRYHQPGSGFRQDGTHESGSLRTVVHVEVGAEMPDCTLLISGSEVDCSNPGFVPRPEVRDWLTGNAGRCREFHTSGRTVAVVPKSLPSGKQLLRILDYLADVADQAPLDRV
ncbi:hypothetical protein GCM10027598_11160 [Amycolatopsis oliviviridis]|uniref:Uncharacterized protein n=1 Tax=Amycolatopsis oliviviridis TaxID=1471590 RepID=A0ABQ3LVH5_9PSEU|nr:hypothetical protein [Amycolatopsis oliviviridis]GHH26858.1 hypothetical protein GCM10017790_54970 [Amycolatopsis oliviviridis]